MTTIVRCGAVLLLAGLAMGGCAPAAEQGDSAPLRVSPVVRIKGDEVLRVGGRKYVPARMVDLAAVGLPASQASDVAGVERGLGLGRERQGAARSVSPPRPVRLGRPGDVSRGIDLLGALGDAEPDTLPGTAVYGQQNLGWLADSVMAAERAEKRNRRPQAQTGIAPFDFSTAYGGDVSGGGYSGLLWGESESK